MTQCEDVAAVALEETLELAVTTIRPSLLYTQTALDIGDQATAEDVRRFFLGYQFTLLSR